MLFIAGFVPVIIAKTPDIIANTNVINKKGNVNKNAVMKFVPVSDIFVDDLPKPFVNSEKNLFPKLLVRSFTVSWSRSYLPVVWLIIATA